MKKGDVHPKYSKVTITCSCGNIINTRSTMLYNLTLDVCGKCHPFYTGKQRKMDTKGRVELFNKRFNITKL